MTNTDIREFCESVDYAINAAMDTESIAPDDIEMVLQERAQDMREVYASESDE